MPFGRITKAMIVRSTPKKQRQYLFNKRSVIRKAVTDLQETKYTANYLTNVFNSVGSAWVYWDPIPGIAEGTDIFEDRLGRRIAVIGFYMYGALVGGCNNLATDDAYNVLRITGVVTNSAAPMGAATIHDIIGKRMEGVEVEKKFLDKYIVMPTVGGDSTGYIPGVKLVKIYKKFKKPVIIDFTQGGVPNKGMVISMISDSSAVTNPGFTIGHLAFMYKDV